jgi:transcriptional regulator with XRE-family HTH domain
MLHCKVKDETSVTFHKLLESLLAERGLSAAELARLAGISHVAVGNYLKGRVPRYQEAVKIAQVFGLSPDYLLDPARFASPLQTAARAAESVPLRQRQAVFDVISKSMTADLSGAPPGSSVMPPGVIDWRARALEAESQLQQIKAVLTSTAQAITTPKK